MRVNSDDHLHICLLWPKISVLKLTRPGEPNSRLYVLSDGTTPVNSLIMCEFYDSIKKDIFRPFYPQFGKFGWPGPDSTRERFKNLNVILHNMSFTLLIEHIEQNDCIPALSP